jgi:hypothetical protein
MNSDNHPDKNSPADLGQLQTLEEKLASEINHLHHELRRVRDGLERVGGASHELEKTALRLSDNIKMCENDLKDNQMKQANVSDQPGSDRKIKRDDDN